MHERIWRRAATAMREWRHALLLAVGLSALAPVARAEPAMHTLGPTPAWVLPVWPELNAKAPADQVSEGVQYLLLDEQIRVDAQDRTRFRHVASKALNERGLESVANIEIRFDPSYQRLTLHAINLRRGGQVIAKLPSAQVKVLQREAGLESLIFDGSRTAHVFLDDVRVGDVVEYAYSVRGSNPVFGNRQFGGFELQYSVPVARIHARLWWPTSRPFHWKRHNDGAEPQATASGEHTVYTWDVRDVPARVSESDAPAGYDPYPSVQWSEFTDWRAVSAWALPLYQPPAHPGPKVQAVISQLAAAQATPQARLLAALNYVQSQIRYLGIEVGPGSHAPNPPETVLERRYGDCKDKTLLTIALLRGLGLAADPALVSTESKQAVEGHLPSPGSFNHVLVRARIGDKLYWLDPTRAPQKGDIDRLVQADHGRALVVAADSTGLVAMAGPEARAMHREVHATLDARAGVGKPASYVVTTTTRGASADSMRASLDDRSRDDLQKQYLNFYTSSFGAMEVTAPFTVFDDAQANEVSVKERYLLKEFWQHSDSNQRHEGNIDVPDISEVLRQPGKLVRSSPLARAHPVDLVQVTEVKLPQGWTIRPETTVVEDAAFRYERREQWDAKAATLTLTDHYESLADRVEPQRLAAYAARLEEARKVSGYVVYQMDEKGGKNPTRSPSQAGTGSGPHWLPAVVGTLALIGGVALARRLYRWDPAVPAAPADDPFGPGPRGIGGWLLLLAISLSLGFIGLALEAALQVPAYSVESWLRLTDPAGEGYSPASAALMLFDLVANLGVLVASGTTNVLFYRRRASLPRAYMCFIGAMAAVVLVENLLAPWIVGDKGQAHWGFLGGLVIEGSLWCAYFARSERVRRTFVRRHAQAPSPGPAQEEPATPPLAGAI
jgi:transglutaminase-like putative cysteine protease